MSKEILKLLSYTKKTTKTGLDAYVIGAKIVEGPRKGSWANQWITIHPFESKAYIYTKNFLDVFNPSTEINPEKWVDTLFYADVTERSYIDKEGNKKTGLNMENFESFGGNTPSESPPEPDLDDIFGPVGDNKESEEESIF